MQLIKKLAITISAVALVFSGASVAIAAGPDDAPRVMGKGGKMSVENRSSDKAEIRIKDPQCMHDNGQQGSQLSKFGGWYEPGERRPKTGHYYIEQKNSGTCGVKSAYFTLEAWNAKGIKIAYIKIKGTNSGWSKFAYDNSASFDVNISNDVLDFYIYRQN
ncbi:MAG: hypothetical protein HOV94_28490 [Saccharothrix sp.]|nr:hypothetical protein [Saccharothrix sp.]